MTVHIKADEPRSTPIDGLDWTAAGEVVAVDDHAIAEQLLRIEGFHEVHPTEVGRHEAPDPDAVAQAEAAAAAQAEADAAAAAELAAADKTPKGGRGKAITEDAK